MEFNHSTCQSQFLIFAILEKLNMKLKLDGEIKILEEAEYMDDIIDERQKDINKIERIMSDVREIAKDFCLEVNTQGDKIVQLDDNTQQTAINVAEAREQINQASRRSRSNG